VNIAIEPGTYVVAVSGGVDSMVLLHELQKMPDLKLVVAHFDHGIRDDSHEDRRLVQDVTRQYGLPFVHNRGNLGVGASEAIARKARYDFLHQVQAASGARAIITAHHQDDWLETAILQLLRGTKRLGVSSIAHSTHVRRPLLHVTKQDIRRHAKANNLAWREDSTNSDTRYKRNYVRKHLMSKLSVAQYQQLLELVRNLQQLNTEIESLLGAQLIAQPAVNQLRRSWFVSLDHVVAREVMAAWLRRNNLKGFDKNMIERLVVRAKTLKPGQKTDISRMYFLQVNDSTLEIVSARK
jgi:tRNA(Ile)-lysidine synthetase-like protein